MRKIFFIVLFLSSIPFSGCNDNSIGPGEYGTGDEYEIYKLILINHFKESDYLIVLSDSTAGEDIDKLCLQQNIPDMHEETISDYIIKNNSRMKIKDIPGFSNYIFSSEYHGNGETRVMVQFSRVGFDRSKSQAVITVGELYAPLVGSGSLIFLKKSGSVWQIEKSILTWIS